MVNDCSVKAYKHIKKRGIVNTKHKQYLSVFVENFIPLNAREVTKLVEDKYDIKISQRGSRLRELEDMGVIKKYDKKKCKITGRLVNRWIWTGKIELNNNILIERCPFCNGVVRNG